ncbi:MAG: hypothetical protein ACREHC_07255 [Candidatus Levyibacteriota bacterium]
MYKNILHIAGKYLHRRVLFQLIIFALISLVMLGIVGFDVLRGELSTILALGGLLLGLIVGYLAGRMFAIKWHEETQKVIIGLDRTGIIVIVLYVAFRFFGKQLFGEFLHGETLTAFTFSSLGGIMIGRLMSMYNSVVKILQEQKILN